MSKKPVLEDLVRQNGDDYLPHNLRFKHTSNKPPEYETILAQTQRGDYDEVQAKQADWDYWSKRIAAVRKALADV